MIEAHGGRVEIDSELGKGTQVMIVLPRETVAAPLPPQAIVPSTVMGARSPEPPA
jgi:hypothetical protein